MKHIKTINELRSDMISGTSGRRIESLEDNKYELKKDVKGATIGNFSNVTLPKGTIIYNLPGGVFADHFSLKNKYSSRSSQGPQYFDKPTFKGIMIKKIPDVLAAIEKNSKVLESFDTVVTEAKDNLYLQLHKKYAEQIKGLKAKKIKKLTDLVSIQRRSMEDREDYFDMDPKKKKELTAEYDEERKLFKKYMGRDYSVMLPKGTESLREGTYIDLRIVNENVNDEIELALTNWLNILAEGDPIKITDLYLDNGVLLGTVAKEIKQGHTEIQAYFDMFVTKSPIGSVDTFILQNFGDICISDGTYTFELDGDDGQRTSVSARYTYVWKKVDGKWMIATHHSSVNP